MYNKCETACTPEKWKTAKQKRRDDPKPTILHVNQHTSCVNTCMWNYESCNVLTAGSPRKDLKSACQIIIICVVL